MRWCIALFLWLVPVMTLAQSQDQTQVIKGDVLYWEGQELVVKEVSGREVRLHVNGETKIQGVAGKLKTGDKIEASVTPQGHATGISLQLPSLPGSPPTSP
jgi:hypothetical protein